MLDKFAAQLPESIFEEFGSNAPYIYEQYLRFLADPSLVGPKWGGFFSELQTQLGIDFPATNGKSEHSAQESGTSGELPAVSKAQRLIGAYRSYGHFLAKTNPLKYNTIRFEVPSDLIPAVDPSEKHVPIPNFSDYEGPPFSDIASLLASLESVYSGSVGFEFTHIMNTEQRMWLKEKIERESGRFSFSPFERLRFCNDLVYSANFESRVHKKYTGSKRFSLEGGEGLIPLLRSLLDTSARFGVQEAEFGMAHRGRLNVLIGILSKPIEEVFAEFEDSSLQSKEGSGDVKYHLGHESIFTASNGDKLAIGLSFNPSHLEAINGVVAGVTRARQDLFHQGDRSKVLPVVIHGDAAFAGQGPAWEAMQLCKVEGFTNGGTVHVVINNQVGFTTDPVDARSTLYCSDHAKAIQAPVFHVNGDDVDALAWVAKLAAEYRAKFAHDVLIDLVCFRKYGHNEGDDPNFTQPVMYAEIKNKTPVSKIYSDKLLAEGVLDDATLKAFEDKFESDFLEAQEKAAKRVVGDACLVHGRIKAFPKETKVSENTLRKLVDGLLTYEPGFSPLPKLQQIREKGFKPIFENAPIEWGVTELLAFGTLVLDGVNVRLTGQDVERATFSQRHAILRDYQTGQRYSPLAKLAQRNSGSGRFEAYNSILSEAAVMGYEFGYGSEAVNSLVLWEGQFGDFANGAQIIIDQFLSSSEQKWGVRSGLVLLLPHGYEGQGPEHSSARLERYLQLSADGNWSVCVPSTAASHFHLLRRQGHAVIKRPLVVLTPKSMLRSQEAGANLSDLTSGKFNPVIYEHFGSKGKTSDTALFMTGKIYHDLMGKLKGTSFSGHIFRLEELYPFPQNEIAEILKKHKIKNFHWVQEEPKNMGAWNYVSACMQDNFRVSMEYVGRPESASTSTGSKKRHDFEQAQVVSAALDALK